jgi:hypothetical protein
LSERHEGAAVDCDAQGMKGEPMPLVRIDLNKDAPAERVRIVSQAVYGAMIQIANVPINDKIEIEGLGTLVNPIADEV